MTTFDRVNQVKASLLTNKNQSKTNLNKINKILNESKDKCSNLIGKKQSRMESRVELDTDFSSMLELTQFILYDADKCLFELSKSDKSEIEHFANEIDSIQNDLDEIMSGLKKFEIPIEVITRNF